MSQYFMSGFLKISYQENFGKRFYIVFISPIHKVFHTIIQIFLVLLFHLYFFLLNNFFRLKIDIIFYNLKQILKFKIKTTYIMYMFRLPDNWAQTNVYSDKYFSRQMRSSTNALSDKCASRHMRLNNVFLIFLFCLVDYWPILFSGSGIDCIISQGNVDSI